MARVRIGLLSPTSVNMLTRRTSLLRLQTCDLFLELDHRRSLVLPLP